MLKLKKHHIFLIIIFNDHCQYGTKGYSPTYIIIGHSIFFFLRKIKITIERDGDSEDDDDDDDNDGDDDDDDEY